MRLVVIKSASLSFLYALCPLKIYLNDGALRSVTTSVHISSNIILNLAGTIRACDHCDIVVSL